MRIFDHQCPHILVTELEALQHEHVAQSAHADEREVRVQLGNASHQHEVRVDCSLDA